MTKNYTLSLLLLCFAFYFGYGQYNVDFESETSFGYASQITTLNGIDWDFNESLIGELANDFKNGLQSARLRGRNGSKLEMVQNKTNGIGTISFEYRRYGSDGGQQPWIVQYSLNNGSTWTQIGAAFTPDGTVRTFSETVGQTGGVRVRVIINSTPGTSGNRRMNVDDIEITDYSGTPNPELQLTDSSSTNQNCGYTIDFGSQALATNTDLTFNISNVGLADLIVSSFDITGDYSILSPAAPLTITPANSQTVTVRFNPSNNGTRNGLLTINNNDLDEGSCTVNLNGIGFTPTPEIDIERNTGASIPNGAAPNTGFNTVFAATVIGNSSAPKTYFVSSEGTADLDLASITSSNPAEFSIAPNPAPSTISPGNEAEFEITFSPIGVGLRTATITIQSNDTNENPYTFSVRGNGECAAGALTFLPDTAPINSVINVTSSTTNFGGATTVTVNGVPATVNVISNSQLEVTIPPGATTGSLEINDDLGCLSSDLFTVLNQQISSCEGSTGVTPGDLFISQITDHGSGSHSYVEIFNGTGADVDLADYDIRIHNNGNPVPTATIPLTGTVLNNDVFVLAFGSSDATNPYSAHGYDLSSSASGINEDDNIRLYYRPSDTWIDLWGDTTGNVFTITSKNYVYQRKNSGITAPSTTWDPNDWDSFTPVDYSDIGTFDFSTGSPPTVNSINDTTSACNEVTITASASEGFSGGNELRYTWYAFNPAQPGLGWQEISNGGIYTTINTSPDLIISDAVSVLEHQFYCEVREDDASCYSASNAIKITLATATWDGTWNWNNGTLAGTAPSLSTNVVLNGNYNTSAGGIQISFEACNLIINPGFDLTVADGNYVEVEHDVIVENNASILVASQGAFIQRGVGAAAGTFTLNGTATSQVNKLTAPLANWYNYTYWSSPVANAVIDEALGFANPNRRFWHNANLYLDADNDDIDDDDNDWVLANGTDQMTIGRGYAATHSNVGFTPGNSYQYNFEGTLNTGDYSYPLAYNAANTDHWNLVGNPYPSAIKVRGSGGLFDANTGIIKTAIYLWSHSSPPLSANNGNEVLNFNTSDYATINGTMSIAGASGIEPENYIPSGQSFFVSSLANTNIVFNNEMRISGDNSNMLFFRNVPNNANSESDNVADEARLWLNLTSDDGVFSQIGIGYVQNAMDGFDGLGYDARRNLSSGNAAIIYSQIEGEAHKLAIQGKATSSLNYEEIIPIGLLSSINENKIYNFSLYKFEGNFLTNNPVYVKDKDLNIIHDLKASDYSFTSEAGEFNNRFEIVFTPNALSIKDQQLSDTDLSIRELPNGDVELTVKDNFSIANVDILDVLGRRIYELSGSSSREVYNLSKLSKAAYIAKVTLSNGQVITKKAIKQR